MNDLADRITYELSCLLGQPITDCWRAADMQIFEFGPQEQYVNKRGEAVTGGRFRLHIQGAWRIVDANRILFAHRDLYDPADPSSDRSMFDWDKAPSLLDVKQRAWFAQHGATPLKVTKVYGDPYGGCRIELENGVALECMSFATGPDNEFWRLLDTKVRGPHFVVTAAGIIE